MKIYKKGLLLCVIFCSILLSACSERSDKQLVATSKIETSTVAGLNYIAIVEQATADVATYQGVPGISTYATLTFVKYQTSGKAEEGKDCPVSDESA